MRRLTLTLTGLCFFASAASVHATSYINLTLHQQVQSSELVVIARVVDPAHALVAVERVFKGQAPKQIVLVSYIDRFMRESDRKPLVANARELLFLNKQGDAYAPLQEQHGRVTIAGDRLIEPGRAQPRRLTDVAASITQLVALQARAAKSAADADGASIVALASPDPEIQKWGTTAHALVKAPSPALADAYLAHWSKDYGAVANGVMGWRLRRAAPVLAKILTASPDGDERAYAAMALGGTGDRDYLPLLRRVASSDAHPLARALAYRGMVWMIGTEALADLRIGAKDAHENVRSQTVVDAYNMLQIGHTTPLWPPASDAVVRDVRAFITGMLSDSSSRVTGNAKAMLRLLARHRP